MTPQPSKDNWRAGALCAQTDPEIFFPESGQSGLAAKRTCGRCEVRAHCLEEALVLGEHFGIWGGLSSGERNRLLATQEGPRPSPTKNHTMARDQMILTMTARGASATAIALELGISDRTVTRVRTRSHAA